MLMNLKTDFILDQMAAGAMIECYEHWYLIF